MAYPKTYKTDKGIYEIPEKEVGSFLKDFPNAMEVVSYKMGKDTFDIPIKEAPVFLKENPQAQPLKKKVESIGGSSEPSDGGLDGTISKTELPTITQDELDKQDDVIGQIQEADALSKKTRQLGSLGTMPDLDAIAKSKEIHTKLKGLGYGDEDIQILTKTFSDLPKEAEERSVVQQNGDIAYPYNRKSFLELYKSNPIAAITKANNVKNFYEIKNSAGEAKASEFNSLSYVNDETKPINANIDKFNEQKEKQKELINSALPKEKKQQALDRVEENSDIILNEIFREENNAKNYLIGKLQQKDATLKFENPTILEAEGKVDGDLSKFSLESIAENLDPKNKAEKLAFRKYKYGIDLDNAINTSIDLNEAALKFASEQNPVIKGQIEKLGNNKLPNAYEGEIVNSFLNSPDVIKRAEQDPEFAKQYELTKSNLYFNYPEFAKKEVATKISQGREDAGVNNWFANVPTKEGTDKLVDKLVKDGKMTEQDRLVYQTQIRDDLGVWESIKRGTGRTAFGAFIEESPIQTPGLLESAQNSFNKTMHGVARSIEDVVSTGTTTLGGKAFSDKERLYNKLQEDASLAQLVPKSVLHEVSMGTGNLAGFVIPMMAGGAALSGVKGGEFIANGLLFEGENKDKALTMFPDDPTKQFAYTAIATAGDVMLGHLIPKGDAAKGIAKTLKGDIVDVVNKFTNKEITAAEAKSTLLNKTTSLLGDLVKENTKVAGTITGFGVFHNTLDALFGGNDMSAVDIATQAVKDFKSNFLTTPLLAAMALKGRSSGIDGKVLMEVAGNPELYKKVITEQSALNPELKSTEKERLQNLEDAALIKKDLDNTEMTDKQKEEYMITAINKKILERKAAGISDKTLKQSVLDQAEKHDTNLVLLKSELGSKEYKDLTDEEKGRIEVPKDSTVKTQPSGTEGKFTPVIVNAKGEHEVLNRSFETPEAAKVAGEETLKKRYFDENIKDTTKVEEELPDLSVPIEGTDKKGVPIGEDVPKPTDVVVDNPALKDVKSTTKALEENKDAVNKIVGEDYKGTISSIAEAYHKAKIDGKNPQLVNAVEQSLSTQELKAGKEVGSGVGGDVETTTNVLNETQKNNPTVWQKIKDAFYNVVGKVHEGFKNTQDFIDNAINGDTQFSELAKALKDKLGDIKTSFVDDLRNKEGKLAYGKHNKDGITVSRKSPHPLQTWFHEAVHKLTVDKLYDYEEGNLHKLSDKDIEAIQNLHRIFGNVQKILNDKGIETKQHNPFKNVREFVAEALTNPEFQEILNKFKGEGKSPTLLKQFLDAVSKLLGLKDGSILDDVFHHTENLFNEGKSEQKNIAEAYHDAKSKGIENDFTKAVEQSLSKEQPSKQEVVEPVQKQKNEEAKVTEDTKPTTKEGSKQPMVDEPTQSAAGEEGKKGITHAAVKELRKIIELPEYEGKPVETHEQLIAEAQETIKNNPNAANEVLDKMENKGKITNKDNAIIAIYKATIDAEMAKNPSKELLERATRLAKALDVSGTEAGKLLESRKLVGQEDNLTNFLLAKQAAQGAELTESQVKSEAAKYEELKTAKEALEKQLEIEREQHAKDIAELGLNKAKAKARKEAKKSDEDYKAERKASLDAAREALKKLRTGEGGTFVRLPLANELAAIAPHVKEYLNSLVSQGVDKLDNAITQIHAEFKDVLDGITKKDVLNIIAGDYDAPKKELTRNETANTVRLLKREAELLKQLEQARKGEEKAKSETEKVSANRRIDEIKEKIKEVQRINKQKTEAEPVEDLSAGSNEDVAKYEQKLQRRIEKLNRDLKEGNYLKEPDKKPIFKKSRKAQILEDRVIDLENKIRHERSKDEYNKRGFWRKAFDKVMEVLGIRRLVQSAVDISVPFRQGATMISLPIPIPVIRNGKLDILSRGKIDIWAKGFMANLQSVFSPKKFDRIMHELRKDPQYHEMIKDGVVFNDLGSADPNLHNEDFRKSFIYKIPIISEPLKASNRSADAFLNVTRLELYKRMRNNLERRGLTRESDPKAFKYAANWAMSMTGRGNMTKMFENPTARTVLGNTFYGARLMASRFNLLNPVTYFDPRVPRAAKIEAMKDMIGFTATTMATGMALAASGGKISLNPDDSDFLQIRFGDKVYDISGGLANYVRTGLRIAKAAYTKATGTKHQGREAVDNAVKSGFNFFRNKLSPNTAYAADAFLGGRYGQDFDPADIARIYPMYTEDFIKSIKEDGGLLATTTVLLPNIFGVGYGSYASKGQIDKNLEDLKERNMRSDEMDSEKIHNYKDGGRLITFKEFNEFADKRDAKIEADLEKLFNTGIGGTPYKDLTPEQVQDETSYIKANATRETKEEMFGKPQKTRAEKREDRKLSKERSQKYKDK